MCNISGYAGTKRAAPILIEMLKKQEFFDGGLSTGIATVDNEGNLYHAKVLGSVEDLLSQTDAINFPGNVGIIHSRPDDSFIEHAHPFVCENEKTAVVDNGNMCHDEKLVKLREGVIKLLLDDGVVFESAKEMGEHPYPKLPDGRHISFIDLYSRYLEYLKKNSEMSYAEAMSECSSKIFSDCVYLMVTAGFPDNIYVSRISRPMNIMKTDDACYLSTSQLAFPEEENIHYMKSLPSMKTCVINKEGFEISDFPIENGNVIDFTYEEYKKIETELRKRLSEKPRPMSNMGGGIYVANTSPDKFRPNAQATYDALWQFKKEGILKTYIDDAPIPWLQGRLVKSTFFSIKD